MVTITMREAKLSEPNSREFLILNDILAQFSQLVV
jgi:hypothetical protein